MTYKVTITKQIMGGELSVQACGGMPEAAYEAALRQFQQLQRQTLESSADSARERHPTNAQRQERCPRHPKAPQRPSRNGGVYCPASDGVEFCDWTSSEVA